MAAVREAVTTALDQLEEAEELKSLKEALLEADKPCTVQDLRDLLGKALVALQDIVTKKVDKLSSGAVDDEGMALLGGLGATALKALVEKVCVKVQKACDPLLHKVALALSAQRKRTTQHCVEMQPLRMPDVEQGGQGGVVPLKRGELWDRLRRGIKAALKDALDTKFESKKKDFAATLLHKALPDNASLGALHKRAEQFEVASQHRA